MELKHVPPAEARLPDNRWRLYIFKNDQLQDEPYRIHRCDVCVYGVPRAGRGWGEEGGEGARALAIGGFEGSRGRRWPHLPHEPIHLYV